MSYFDDMEARFYERERRYNSRLFRKNVKGDFDMPQNDPQKVVTGEVRLSYVHLNEPYVNPKQANAEPKYSVMLLIPKSDEATYRAIMGAIEAATNAAVNDKWGGVRPPIVPNPVHDGDGVKQDGTAYDPECKGCWVMNASRKPDNGPPWVCDVSNINVRLEPKDSYSGMYARCSVRFYGYLFNGRKGVGVALEGVMKTRDGEPLGGAVTPSADDFAQFAQASQQANPFAVVGNPAVGNPVVGNPVVGNPAAYGTPAATYGAPGQINPLTGLPM